MCANDNRIIFDPEFIVLLGKEKRNHFRIFGGMRISEISTHLNTHSICAARCTCLIFYILFNCLFLFDEMCACTDTTMCSSVFLRVTRFSAIRTWTCISFARNVLWRIASYLLWEMFSHFGEREREWTKKIDSKKIVQTQNQKYPTNRSRCNTYLVYIFSYPVVWTFSCVFSYFSHLGNHYSAVIHPRFFSINHTIHDLKLSVGDVTETTVRDPHSYTTTVC